MSKESKKIPELIELVTEDGEKSFYREVVVESINDRVVVGVGFPYMWEYTMLKEYPPRESDRLYVDASGRNFGVNSGVYCSYEQFMKIVEVLL